MKKSDFWIYNWIHITKRLPPKIRGRYVIVWNYESNEPLIMESFYAHFSADNVLQRKEVSWDRRFNYWAIIEPPSKKKRKRKNETKQIK